MREDIVKRMIIMDALNAGIRHQFSETHGVLKSILSHYGYMTGFIISNNSAAEIELRLDGMRRYRIPAAMVHGDDHTRFSWFEIENMSLATDINADEVTITLLNEVTEDRVVNRIFRGFLGMSKKNGGLI